MNTLIAYLRLGRWLSRKALQQSIDSGTFAAARNLRKQGVPLELALLTLTGRLS